MAAKPLPKSDPGRGFAAKAAPTELLPQKPTLQTQLYQTTHSSPIPQEGRLGEELGEVVGAEDGDVEGLGLGDLGAGVGAGDDGGGFFGDGAGDLGAAGL